MKLLLLSCLWQLWFCCDVCYAADPTPTPAPLSKEEMAKRFKECSKSPEAFKICKDKYK